MVAVHGGFEFPYIHKRVWRCQHQQSSWPTRWIWFLEALSKHNKHNWLSKCPLRKDVHVLLTWKESDTSKSSSVFLNWIIQAINKTKPLLRINMRIFVQQISGGSRFRHRSVGSCMVPCHVRSFSYAARWNVQWTMGTSSAIWIFQCLFHFV